MANNTSVRCFWARRTRISSSSQNTSQTATTVSKLRASEFVHIELSGGTINAYVIVFRNIVTSAPILGLFSKTSLSAAVMFSHAFQPPVMSGDNGFAEIISGIRRLCKSFESLFHVAPRNVLSQSHPRSPMCWKAVLVMQLQGCSSQLVPLRNEVQIVWETLL